MKNPDVRGTCVALIKSRLSGPAGARAPRAAALGWKLAQSDVSLAEMAALCEPLLGAAPAEGHWALTEPLRALMSEYGRVRAAAGPTKRVLGGGRAPRLRSAPDVNGVYRGV